MMAPSVKSEVLLQSSVGGNLGPDFVDDDFYMATFRGGKVQKVNNTLGGPPRRVRRVLDFDSEVEIEKEEALARKRKELASGYFELEEPTVGEKEKTLAEELLEMRKRKSAVRALATVERKKLAPSTKSKSAKIKAPRPVVKNVIPVEAEVVIALDDDQVHTATRVDQLSTEEVAVPVELSPLRKKRKRRSTGLMPTCLDPPSEAHGDNETLAEHLKKSASATGRASSDNAGIKVFQRRKVKFKAVRKRTNSSPVGDSVIISTSASGDKQSSSILVCDDLCECEVCSFVAPSSVDCPTTCSRDESVILTTCSTCTEFSGDIPEDDNQIEHPDSCMGEFDTLTLPDDPPPVPVLLHYHAPIDDTDGFVDLTDQALHLERVDELVLSNSALKGSDFVVPDESFGVEGEQLHPCSFNTESSSFSAFPSPFDVVDGDVTHPVTAENTSASVVTPMELDQAVERIESILDTLVTPDDLLPTDLAASISSAAKSSRKKKKKRRRFSESSVSLEGSALGEFSRVSDLRQEEDLAALNAVIPSLTDSNVPTSVSDVTEEVSVPATSGSGDTLAEQISEQISDQISDQISKLLSQEHSPTLSLLSEERDRPGACSMDVALVLPSSEEDVTIGRNPEECSPNGSNSLVPLRDDAVETVVETPTVQSPSCNLYEGSGICQTPPAGNGLDAAEANGGVGDTSTSKGLFNNLKTDGFSKRNRKSFSPRSQKALIEASRPERSTPTFKIKLMRSNLSDRCSTMLFSQKMVVRRSSPTLYPHPRPDDSIGQDILQCDAEQIQSDSHPLSPPSQSTENMSAPSPPGTSSNCIVPGSPEYKTEPHVSRQRTNADPVSISSSVTNLPCTEGSLHVEVECLPGTPSDPKTPNGKVEPHLKSILKTRSDTCRGICECPRCVSTCNVSTTARNFIRSQMRMADDVARKLLDEIRNLRTLVEDASGPRGEDEAAAASASCVPPELKQAKGALDSATKAEDWATKEMLKMSRDSKRVCRLIEVGPRRTIFADDAGHRLCQVKVLPAKKTLSKESLLPTNS